MSKIKIKIKIWERCGCGCNEWIDKSYGDNIKYICKQCGETFEA